MDITFVILGSVLMLLALIGCVVPVLIGPPLAYAGLLFLHFSKYGEFSIAFLIIAGILTVISSVLDNVFSIMGAQQFGGSKRAIIGATAGTIAGIFILPPVGMLLGAFIGAFIGEISAGKEVFKSIQVSFGTFVGFIAGIALKLSATFIMIFFFVLELIKN
ncbi:MAG TPA: DUF456 domain-containing protein [Candidatus Goldiibacteriota bacterium]|nr:DUF456 domain-containing protein [Candidatus Goldiibacteriota bacterium]HPN64705.1 DUF456 domain-containing protein [Candidatus Goldiibacteriota bacterium]HRQ43556.1 DUF456 domain-containing protein [Candidatus Goldiibacteriota bacterium]